MDAGAIRRAVVDDPPGAEFVEHEIGPTDVE